MDICELGGLSNLASSIQFVGITAHLLWPKKEALNRGVLSITWYDYNVLKITNDDYGFESIPHADKEKVYDNVSTS